MLRAVLVLFLATACAPLAPVDLGALGPGSAILLLERDGDRISIYATELTAEGALLFGAPSAGETLILAYGSSLRALGFVAGRVELEPPTEPPNPDARRLPRPAQVLRSNGEGQLERGSLEDIEPELTSLRLRPRYSELLGVGRCLGPAPALWSYECPDVMPAAPTLPNLPLMLPCAPGFEAQNLELHAGFADIPRAKQLDVMACVPNPSQCPGQSWPSLDGSGCRDLSGTCLGFPADAPREALYVDATSVGPGAGTRADPYSSLDEAILRAVRGATIALAAGQHSLSQPLDRAVRLWGACPGSTEILVESAGLVVRSAEVELRDLSLRAPSGRGILAQSSTVTVRRCRVAASGITLAGTSKSELRVESTQLISAQSRALQLNDSEARLTGSTLGDEVTVNGGALTVQSSWIKRTGSALLRTNGARVAIQGSHLEMPLDVRQGDLSLSDSELAPASDTATAALVVQSTASARRVLVDLRSPGLENTAGLRFLYGQGQTVVEDVIVRRSLLPDPNTVDHRAGLGALGASIRAARVVVEGGTTVGALLNTGSAELEDLWLVATVLRPAVQLIGISATVQRLGVVGAAGPGVLIAESAVLVSDARISLVSDTAIDAVGGSTLSIRRLDLDEYSAGGLLVGTANETSGPRGNVFRGEDIWVHGAREKLGTCFTGCPEAIYIYSHTQMSLRRFRVEGARVGLRARRTAPLGQEPLAAEGSVLNCVIGLLLEHPQGRPLDPEPYLSVVSAPGDARRQSLVIQPVSLGSAGNDRL